MENSSKAISRRERRRRQNDEKCESEDNEDIIVKDKKSAEKDSKADENNSRILVRRDTFTVLKPGMVFESGFSIENKDEGGIGGNEINAETDTENSKNLTHTINVETWNTDSRNLTYDINNEKCLSKHDTYSIQMTESDRPVPAPRKRQNIMMKEPDKNSSDTDKDVMEIEVDEGNTSELESPEKQPVTLMKTTLFESDTSAEEPPKPKPRKLSSISVAFPRTESMSKSKSLEEITVKVISPRSTRSDPETKHYGESMIEERPKPPKTEEKSGKKRFAGLLQRRKGKKSSKMLSSVIKLEKARIQTISSLLRDLKEDATKAKLEEEDRTDFEIDSPRLPKSAPNDKVYVQYKNGFYLTNRKDVFKTDDDILKRNGEERRMEDATTTSNMLKTGMVFQKYWSRLIVYIHGILAGLGFGHAFTITAILYYFNKSEGFIDVYACLALKIYFIFYILIAVCIISCLDRLDIGHMSKKHWRKICSKCPSSWCVLVMYLASFLLTFANHNTEFRFDSHQYGNATREKLWDPEVHDGVATKFSCWYRIVWARDVVVLAAWLLICLTDHQDNLRVYLQDLAAEGEILTDDKKLGIIVS